MRGSGVPPPLPTSSPHAHVAHPPAPAFFSRAFFFGAGTAFDFGGGGFLFGEECLPRRTTKRKREGCLTRRPSPTRTASASVRGGGGGLRLRLGGGAGIGGGGGACPLPFFLHLPCLPNSHPLPKPRILTPQLLRRHKLPTPHLALWSTEVHVVVRGKVCETGCYFLGIQTPLVATCKNKVYISNICHYLHFWKHTDFQNKDIQSPKYSVVLHLDHCIPVRGGGGLPIFSLPFVPG